MLGDDPKGLEDTASIVRALDPQRPGTHELAAARHRTHRAIFGVAASTGAPTVGRFEIREFVGRGGMGSVYRAWDPVLGREVAIKVLHRAVDEGPNDRQLVVEASAMATLRHPNIAQVYDVGVDDGTAFVAMEFVEGETLRTWQRRGHGWRTILRRYVQAGRGLAAAHAGDVVHGDFKPDNVLIGDDGRTLVTDFSIGPALRAAASPAVDTLDDSGRPKDQEHRFAPVVTTRAYLSPEAADGAGPVDARADQYAFCVALHEALFGCRPPKSGGAFGTPQADSPTDARGAPRRVPVAVREALRRGLARQPSERHRDLSALVNALERPLRRPRRLTLALGALSFVVVGAVVGAVGDRARSESTCRARLPDVEARWGEARDAMVEREGPGTTAVVVPAFDGFVEQWGVAVGDHCAAKLGGEDAAGERGEACLVAAGGSFFSALALMEHEDLDPYDLWVSTVIGLPQPARCLSAGVAGAGPGRHERADLLTAVVGARVQRRYAEALAAANGLSSHAAKERDFELMALAELERSRNLRALGRLAEARAALDDAITLAESAEARRVLLTSLTERSAMGVNEEEPWTDLQARAHRAALLADRLGDPVASLSANLHLGYAQLRSGDPARAIETESAALARAERDLGPDHLELAYAHDYVGAALAEAGRGREALVHKRRAVAIAEARLGVNHPDLATLLLTSGRIHMMVGERGAARPLFERAVTLREAAHGVDHPRVREARRTLAWWWSNDGDLERALGSLELDGTDMSRDERWRQALLAAGLCVEHGRIDLARSWIDRAGRALEPSEHAPAMVRLLAVRARTEAGTDPAGARADARAALTLADALGDGRAQLTAVLAALEVSLVTDHADARRAHAQRLGRALEELPGIDPSARARGQWLLAQSKQRDGLDAQLERRAARAAADRGLGVEHPLRRAIYEAGA